MSYNSYEFNEIENKLKEMKIKKQTNEELINSRKNRLEEIKHETEVLLKSQSILQQVATEVQSKLSIKFDSIVNLGLATCFGDEYVFKLEYVPSRGKTEVHFNLYDKQGELVDPTQQCGGGLVDLLCFCLRVAVFNISRKHNVIIYDEAFKFVSKGLKEKTAELVHTLSERLNLQFIEVTHINEFMENSDKQFIIKKTNGVSDVL